MPALNLGIMASHTGTNFQALLDACNQGRLNATCRVVISNNSSSMALRRARSQGVPGYHLSAKTTHLLRSWTEPSVTLWQTTRWTLWCWQVT